MNILSIETSCDDTAAAVVGEGPKILASFRSSQIPIHRRYGGVVPELASRKHLENIIPVIIYTLQKAANSSSKNLKELAGKIDAVAVTTRPGLLGSLLVGVNTAKTLSWLLDKPIIPVDHIKAHIFANFLENPNGGECHSESPGVSGRRRIPMGSFATLRMTIKFPAMALVVSGGHTELIFMKNLDGFDLVGGTRDDAAGEALDKVAKLLGFDYPGGPDIERCAKKGKKNINFPTAMAGNKSFDFSFSGLKTSALYFLRKNPKTNRFDLCASFQDAVIKSLLLKSVQAVKKYNPKSFLLAGGVIANQAIIETFKNYFSKNFPDTVLYFPQKEFCTDNAAMVGVVAYYDFLKNRRKKWYDVDVEV